MFCDYCRRLFELRQNVKPYTPRQKGLAGYSSSSSHPLSIEPQLALQREEDQEWRKQERDKTIAQIRSEKPVKPKPEFAVYEDTEDLFTPRELWWQVPVGCDGFQPGQSHVPDAACQICRMTFSDISAPLLDLLVKRNSSGQNQLSFVYKLSSIPKPRRVVAEQEAILSIWLQVAEELVPLVKLHAMKDTGTCIPRFPMSKHDENPNTGSPETLALATSWIRNCDLRHSECRLHRRQHRRLPTRLIYVGTQDGKRKARLCIPKTSAAFVEYVALSYRWPASPKLVLTKATVANLRNEIPIDSLPQSNRDAIDIVRRMGLKYLWIDALCIFQDLDDSTDWLKESALMGDVYKFAYFTISASQASTNTGGCFAEHQPLELRMVHQDKLDAIARQNHLDSSQMSTMQLAPTTHPTPSEDWFELRGEMITFSPRPIPSLIPKPFLTPESTVLKPQVAQVYDQTFTPMKSLSMLNAHETILELVLRNHIQQRPGSTILRCLYDGLQLVQPDVVTTWQPRTFNMEMKSMITFDEGVRDDVVDSIRCRVADHRAVLQSYRKGSYSRSSNQEHWSMGWMQSWSRIMTSLQRMGKTLHLPGFDPRSGHEYQCLMALMDDFSSAESWLFHTDRVPQHLAVDLTLATSASIRRFSDFTTPSIEENEQEIIARAELHRDLKEKQHYTQYNQLQLQRDFINDRTKADVIVRTWQRDLWTTEVDNSPLSRRGWTLQERLLSTRVLHFTRSQLFWECQVSKACESYPQLATKTLRSPMDSEGYGDGDRDDKRNSAMIGMNITPLELHWEDIVELYTDAHLTQANDKLVAISSLAKEIQNRTKDRYFAGLWSSRIASSLLFCLEVPQHSQPAYRAPSWSWASVDGKVLFMTKYSKRSALGSDITNIWTVGEDGVRGSTGQIKDGSLTLSGPPWKVLRYEKRGNSNSVIWSDELLEGETSAEFFPDTKMISYPSDTICVPVLYYEDPHTEAGNSSRYWLGGLVLLPSGEFHDEYRRIGVFRMRNSAGKKWFEDMEHSTISII